MAWAQQANGSSKIHYGLRVLPEWPDAREERKVPSQISYAATSSGKKQWGFSIEPGSNVFGWTKMELMPQSPAKELLVLCRLLEGQKLIQDLHSVDRFPLAVPRHLIKDAGEVIEDFLSRVARQWHSYMTKEGNVALEEIVLDVIVTFPAVLFTSIPIVVWVQKLISLVVELWSQKCNSAGGPRRSEGGNVPSCPRFLCCIGARGLRFVQRPRYACKTA